jgi:putative pyruvate formate lyase activating enzyme
LLPADELARRARALLALQRPCELCPRRCRADRARRAGFCAQGPEPVVATCCAHGGEEPALSGSGGAGTVFMAGCTLRCRFCQNHQLSQADPDPAWTTTAGDLARRWLALQRAGCHNIEWVSPTPHLPALVQALALARRQGLTLPVVYNSGGYERVRTLRLLRGVVDVYLPDAKYADGELARELSGAADYVEVNRRALREMWRQAGPLRCDDRGLARRGLVVRHLVLPGQLRNTRRVLGWLGAELGPRLCVSLMAQYYPAHRAAGDGGALGRGLTRREHRLAQEALLQAGLQRGWVQERRSRRLLRPDFSRAEVFDRGSG